MSTEALLTAAKTFLMAYFSDGSRKQPADFDREILGINDDFFFVRGRKPIWNETIFCTALGELVEEGYIKFAHIEEMGYVYWMPKQAANRHFRQTLQIQHLP